MDDLWGSDDAAGWREALDSYERVVAGQGVARLPALDHWYRLVLPDVIKARPHCHVTKDELVQATEWKMARGVWRQRNLLLVRSNPPDLVEQTSADAFDRIADDSAPITILSTLAGVGPATASAVVAAVAPERFPFFDDLVAAQVPDLGKVEFTARAYLRYADALRVRAQRLGGDWTAALIERALWAHAGGKAGRV